jgi:RNA polymerase sigma-70 factor (ECF subfamily)
MARAQDGDRGGALLEDITPYLRALATRCFRDGGDIEDAVQDVSPDGACRPPRLCDPGRPFGPWLVAIANRRIIDRLRRQMRARSREIELTAEHETFCSIKRTSSRTSVDIRRTKPSCMRQSSSFPDQRQAIRLLKLKEMSLKEAALTSGKSVSGPQGGDPSRHQILRKLLRQPSETP